MPPFIALNHPFYFSETNRFKLGCSSWRPIFSSIFV